MSYHEKNSRVYPLSVDSHLTPLDNLTRMVRDDTRHVFFINNPVVLVITALIIDAFKIHPDRIIVISLRGMDCSIIPASRTFDFSNEDEGWILSVARKFGLNLSAEKLATSIEDYTSPFLVYAAWAFREVLPMFRSRFFRGCFFLEEGDAAYSCPNFATDNRNVIDYARKLLGRLRPFYDQRPALGFIGLFPECFPFIENRKRLVIDNHRSISKFYSTKLKNFDTIILVPYRPPNEFNFIELWELSKDESLGQVAFKFHPNYYSRECRFRSVFSSCTESGVDAGAILPRGVLLEAEMILTQKTLIGDLPSSALRYAQAFGWKFSVRSSEK